MKKFDFVIDFETLGARSDAAVIDLATVLFDPDPMVVPTFEEIVATGKRWKFDFASQKTGERPRCFDTFTIDWWKKQSVEARLNLKPASGDMDPVVAIIEFINYLRGKVDPFNSIGYCRGQSFDFPIMVDLLTESRRREGNPENAITTYDLEPVKFWQQRDIRTRIEALLMTRGLTTTPLPKGVLKGFIAHDSLHDCAKDVLMLKYAERYALGLEEAPIGDNIDPLSLPKGRQ